MTLAEIARDNGKVILNGETWDVMIGIRRQAILTRFVIVKGHTRRFDWVGTGYRRVTIRRPADLMATVA